MSPTLTVQQTAHLAHGKVDWCLHCPQQDQAGTMPQKTEELGWKGRTWTPARVAPQTGQGDGFPL